ADLGRAGLAEAMRGDPVIRLAGGHTHAGAEAAAFAADDLAAALDALAPGITGFAVASSFATRNPGHEIAARDMIRARTGLPVSCSHDLSQALNGPKRALTAVLNARLIGMIDRLIRACQAHLDSTGIDARLMVVRGDGALISADVARDRPIETILSGPAASVAGAQWLTGATDALISDIGGTTTDVCLLQDGRPRIDPRGAQVGPFRTMVEAVAMRTTGLGGDSEVHVQPGLDGGLRLGPRRAMPISLAAMQFPEVVHAALDHALGQEIAARDAGTFIVPMWDTLPSGLDAKEAVIADRLSAGPLPLNKAVRSRMESPALARMLARGQVLQAAVTPSDAAHVAGLTDAWDDAAAAKALALFARKRTDAGQPIAADTQAMAQMIIDQLTAQTVTCLLQSAFAEDDLNWEDPVGLAAHPLTRAGLDRHAGVVAVNLSLGVPVIGLGASAGTYYGAVGERLGTQMIVPDHAGVANAIGAVVGQVRMQASGTITSGGDSAYIAHLPDGPQSFGQLEDALKALRDVLQDQASRHVRAAGVDDVHFAENLDLQEIDVDGRRMFIEAAVRIIASGRPRIADDALSGPMR
ncbi:MAG: hydantoinase/oxoprolinase family protein, partial [Pseudomonadota bacterium]